MSEQVKNPLEHLGDDWTLGHDGIPYREAARIIPIRPDGRILLVRGHDFYDKRRRWWFTVGGGRAESETSGQGAIRELREETGIIATQDALIGPVLRRYATFYFLAITCRQDEDFYLLHISDEDAEMISPDDWSDAEWGVLDELGWWDLADLEKSVDQGMTLYPGGLVEYLHRWLAGWDGVCEELVEDSRTPAPDDEENFSV